MAEVYRARDLRLDRTVAIKTLRADLARDQTFQARFRREAQSAASLNNPAIVAVYDTGEDLSSGMPVPFIVMEFVEGRTVRDLLIEGHRLLPERTLEITSGVLRALEYSHQAGIVHRDIKPGNVMVTRNGDIKVMDFGIARAMSDAQATMTQTAQVIGTAQYLSPEQARGERVDARSDLYSTGCLMYELLTGRPPFTGDSPVAIAYQHVRENPVPPSRLDASLPSWADSIVLKAMAKSPNDRYQSAAEMNADIQRAASGMQTAASLQPPTRLDYYEQQRTQHMGPQTMMGAAPTSVTPYQNTGYQTGYQQPHGGGYDGGAGDQRRGGRRWVPWLISGIVVLAAIAVAVVLLKGGGSGSNTSVPLVGNDTWAQAEAAIKQAGLNPVENKEASGTVKSGYVISTNPSEGNSVAKNTTVTVNVSTGAANISLPNVQGQQANAAQATLQNAGFTNVSQVSDSQSTLPSGEVDHQSPAPGSYSPNTAITLYVSGGGIKVPSVTNETAAEASATLSGEGFTNVQTVSTAAPASQMVEPGTVYNQTPAAGQIVPANQLIQIFVEPENATASPTATPTDTTTFPGGTPTDTTTATPTPTDTTTNGNGNGNGGNGNGDGGITLP
jgi:eukaryotic-like serine/threonine-protein kinase